MTKTPNRLFALIAILSTAFMQQTVHAEQTLVPVANLSKLTIQLPKVDLEALIEKVVLLRSQLIQRKQVLVQIVADKALDSSDAIITAIMPGGLLYAGYRKAGYEQAKSELAQVNIDIEEFSGDLLAMQSIATPVVVAQLR